MEVWLRVGESHPAGASLMMTHVQYLPGHSLCLIISVRLYVLETAAVFVYGGNAPDEVPPCCRPTILSHHTTSLFMTEDFDFVFAFPEDDEPTN